MDLEKGDYELYYSLKLHTKRIEHGKTCPPFGLFSRRNPNVIFFTEFTADEDFEFCALSVGSGYMNFDSKNLYGIGENIKVSKGFHKIIVNLLAVDGFPALFIDSPYLKTDST